MASFYRMDPVLWDHRTADLSLEEEAAFLRICNAIYRSERGCVMNDRVLAGMFRSSTRKARALVARLIEAGKVFVRDGYLWNEKAEREISSIRNKDQKTAESDVNRPRNAHETTVKGQRNGREPDTNAERNDSELPDNSLKVADLINDDPPPKTRLDKTKTREEREEKDLLESHFEKTIWLPYPRRLTESGTLTKGSRQEAFKLFKALSDEERQEAVNGLAGFKRVYPDSSKAVCDCVRYLRHQRWRDIEGLAVKPEPGIVLPKNGLAPKVQRLVKIVGVDKYRAWFENSGVCMIEPSGDGAMIRTNTNFAAEEIQKRFFNDLNAVFGFKNWRIESPAHVSGTEAPRQSG